MAKAERGGVGHGSWSQSQRDLRIIQKKATVVQKKRKRKKERKED
jgi:hypothetical protein